MATMIVAFDTEQEAQEAINELMQANLGEVRARVLDSSEQLSYPKTDATAPVITPEMGSIEVRPSEPPKIPGPEHEDQAEEMTGAIPTTGGGANGVQVMIEVNDEQEARVRQILSRRQGAAGNQPAAGHQPGTHEGG